MTGVLTFKMSPNYEDPKDVVGSTTPSKWSASDNEYIVVVSRRRVETDERELTCCADGHR